MTAQISLVVVRNPFDRSNRDERALLLAPDTSIADIIAAQLPMSAELAVSIDGELITREEWASRTLKPGEQLVVMPQVHDGDILGSVLMIAVAIYAPYLVNFAAGSGFVAAGAGTFAATGMGIAMTIGVNMLGAMVVGGLMAPQKPSLPSRGLQSYDNSPAYSWSPATTQQPGGVVNRAYGRHKLYGNIIAGYIENQGSTGQEQIAHLLIDLGMGPYNRLYDFKLNDQPVGYYSGVTITERRGYLNQAVIPAFNDTRLSRNIGAKVVLGTPITRDTVGSDYNALEIVLICPNGLWYANDAGGMDVIEVRARVEISADGGATWWQVEVEPYTIIPAATGYWALGRWGRTRTGRRWYQYSTGSSVPTDHYEGELDSSDYTWHWMAVETEIATTVYDSITLDGNTQQPIRRTLRADNLARGTTYKVRVSNLTADQTTSRYGDDLYLAEINEVMYDDFQYPRTVLVGVDALATNQISGSIKFSCLAEAAIVRVWNGSAWSSVWSNNPAWVCWDILTQPVLDNNLAVLRYDGLDPARLNLASFYAWAQFCDVQVPDGKGGWEARCTFDGVFDTPTSLWDAALEVCATGRAQLVIRGTTVAVVFDDVRATPAQLFNVGNTSVNSFSETFLPMQDRAASIEVDYIDAAQDYARLPLTVPNTAITESTARRTSTGMRGVTRASQVWREAFFRLKRNELLKRSASISVDIDALACTVGDLIWLQNDVTRWGVGGRAIAGSTTTKLMLDQSVTLDSGKVYELKLRLADDTLVTRTITTAAGTVTAVDVSVAFPSAPALYDVYAIGETSKAAKEFIVLDITRDGDQRAKLSLIEYNATLYGLDSGIPALPTIDIQGNIITAGLPPPLPAVNNLRIEESLELSPAGIVVVHLDAYFEMSDAHHVDVYVGGRRIGESVSGVFRLSNVNSGSTYSFSMHPFGFIGESPSATWKSITHLTVGLFAVPADLSGFGVQSVSALDVLSWTQSADLDVRFGGSILIRHSPALTGATWETSTGACEPQPGTATSKVLPLRAGTYFIKAQDSSGIQSKNAASFVSAGSSLFTYTSLGTIQEDPTFPGTFTNTYHDSDSIDVLELIGASLFDDGLDFDTGSGFDYAGGVVLAGSYNFNSGLDLGSVKQVRLKSIISATAENVLINFDEGGDFDSGLDFDNTSGAPVDAWVEVRSTPDNPSASPTWGAWQRLAAADFNARGFQFRAQLTSLNPVYNIAIDQLRITTEAL